MYSNDFGIVCPFHSNSLVSHVCISKNCFTPLCPKCIKRHNEYHKLENEFPEMETLEDLKEICCQKLSFHLQECKSEMKESFTLDKNHFLSEFYQKITRLKSILSEITNNFFEDFKEKYLQNNFPKFFNEKNADEKLYVLENQLFLIKNGGFSIEIVKEILTSNYKMSFDKKKNGNLQESLAFQEKNLQNFCSEYQNLLIDFFSQPKSSPENKLDFSLSPVKKFESPIFTSSTKAQKNPESMLQKSKNERQNINITTSSKEKIKKKDSFSEPLSNFQINVKDYFENPAKSFLHFFQAKSKNLHFFVLDPKNPSQIKMYTKEIEMDSLILRWHKSIATPSGKLFLLGGASVDIKAIKKNSLFEYLFEQNKLKQKSPMSISRSGFGLVYMNNHLYVLGGNIDESQTTSRCEKYNILSDTWSDIANLNLPASNFNACCFNENFIYKFGGKMDDNFLVKTIEKYNPKINRWIILNFRFEDLKKEEEFKLLAASGCCQINQNHIIVFGGAEENFQKKSQQCFLLGIFEENEKCDYVIRGLDEKKIEFNDTFTECNAFVFGGKVYALQNLTNDFDKAITFLDKKRVLIFDGLDWESLNS